MQPGYTRPYQGYPYTNPMVIDVPSISPEAANQWANLPRRPIAKGWRHPGFQTSPGCSGIQRKPSPTIEEVHTTLPSKRDPDETPVVYIDLPEGSGSDVVQHRRMQDDMETSSVQSTPSPTVEEVRPTLPSKRDPDESPVVYIDLPEGSGSDVVQHREIQDDDETSFVQDTIMFDQFENRRIDVGKRSEHPDSERSSISESQDNPGPSNAGPFTTYREPHAHQGRPTPPNTLDLNRLPPRSPMDTNSSTCSTKRPAGLPPFLQNETYVYGGDLRDASAEFPEPPPAYTETETMGSQTSRNIGQRQPELVVEFPRTQVITPDAVTPMGLPNHQRKFLTCHHCGLRVHSLVIKEIGFITHTIACVLFLIMLPLVLLVYCTDFFKHKNHYCPNCNKLIGYVRPIVGGKIYFVN